MQYTDWLKWGILGILCTLLLVPFIVADGQLYPNFFFPFITGKNFTFRILIEIALGLYILLALREPKYRPRGSLLFWAVVGLVAWVGLATVFSVDPLKSFWSNFERMEGYVALLHLLALFIIAGAVLTAEKWWDRFFKLSIAAASWQGLYALFQLLGWMAISTQSGARVDTTFGNATYLAVYMLFNIFFTLYILTREQHSRFMQSLYGLALVLQITALLYTQTRGAILGFVGGLIIMGLYVAWQGRDPRFAAVRKWAIGGVMGLALLVAGLYAVRDTSFVQNSAILNRLASISLEDKTTQSRFMIWGMAFEGFKEKPILGWGQENFSFVFNKYYNPNMYDQEQWFDRAHNQFFDWLLAAGLPAFFLFLSFFFVGAWIVFRSSLEVPAQAALLGLLGGYAFHSLLVFDNLISAMYLFLLLAFLHSLTPQRVPRFLFMSRPLGDHGVAIAAPIALVFVVSSIWFLNVPGITRAQSLIDAITTQTLRVANGMQTPVPRDPKENIAAFERTLDMGVLGEQEVIEQLYQYSFAIANNSSMSPEIKEQVYTLTRTEGEKLLAERPDDARLEFFFGTFLNQFGRHEEALTYFDRAVSHSPSKQQILFQAGLTRIALNDYTGALEIFKNAFDAAPSNDEARIYYAMVLYYNSQAAQADQLLIEKFGTVIVDNERLLQMYTTLSLFDRVVGIWEERVKKNPTDVQTHVNLASAYFAAGDKAKTIATLRKVAEIDPSTATQVQNTITQIENGTIKANQ